jgi:hypothetical protein
VDDPRSVLGNIICIMTFHITDGRRFDFAERFEVMVGSEKKIFIVHRDVTTDNCPFFNAALSHRWTKGNPRAVELPDVEPRDFKNYLACLYSVTTDSLKDNDKER